MTELLVLDLIAQHDPQPDPVFACRGDSGFAHSLLAELASIEALQLGIAPHGMQRGFAPEKTQQRVAVFTQPAEPLSRPTGVLLGIIPT